MAILSLVATAEALLISASHAKRRRIQRQQILMGSCPRSCSLPFLDDHMKRKTSGASRLQSFAASRLAEVCRQIVQLRLFEYLLLHVIRTVLAKRRNKLVISTGRVSL
jgi:hypothetical protein